MQNLKLDTPEDALTLALVLAITAPTEDLMQECSLMALEIGKDMTAKEFEICKAAALCVVEFKETYQ
tara:strand:- start:3058 stop:3258 length:201 start_codon:yes stop_codon:yes gene_type:complete